LVSQGIQKGSKSQTINTIPAHTVCMPPLSDHQDTDSFSYTRTWDEMETMLDMAERKLNHHRMQMDVHPPKSKKWFEHARNFKALQGVIKTIRWTLGDKNIKHPLD
jgi:hypothetical protein